MFKKLNLFLLLFVGIVFSQNLSPKYIVYKETTLSSAAEVITIQQPATGAKIVNVTDAYIYCSVACNPTVEINGTPATTTSLAVIAGGSLQQPSAVTAWSGSNVGVGTVVSKIPVPAGTAFPLDMTGLQLSGPGTSKNITIRTDAITGTVRIQFRILEQ